MCVCFEKRKRRTEAEVDTVGVCDCCCLLALLVLLSLSWESCPASTPAQLGKSYLGGGGRGTVEARGSQQMDLQPFLWSDYLVYEMRRLLGLA